MHERSRMKRPSPKTRILPAALLACLLALPWFGAAALASPHGEASTKAQPTPVPGKHHRKKKPAQQRPTYWGAWIGPQLTGNQPPWDMSAVGRFSELAA